MNEFFKIVLTQPISNIFAFFYLMSGQSFIISVTLILILLRIVLFPLTKSQQESNLRLKDAKPRIDNINKKYEKDPAKKQQEIAKLYKEINYKPLGCLTSILIQFPIIISLYSVISSVAKGGQLEIYQFILNIFNLKEGIKFNLYEIGLNLGIEPSKVFSDKGASGNVYVYIGIVALVVISQALSSIISTKLSGSSTPPKKKDKSDTNDSPIPDFMTNSTMFIYINTIFISIMIGNISWKVPLGLSIYWIIQSVLYTAEQLIIHKFFIKKNNIIKK